MSPKFCFTVTNKCWLYTSGVSREENQWGRFVSVDIPQHPHLIRLGISRTSMDTVLSLQGLGWQHGQSQETYGTGRRLHHELNAKSIDMWHDYFLLNHHMTMAQNDWPDWSPIPQMCRFSPKSNHIWGPFGTFCWASPPHIVPRRVCWYPSEHAGQPLFLLLLHSLTFFSQSFLTDPTLMIWKQTRRRPTSPQKPIPVLKWVMAIAYFGNPTVLNRIPLFKNLTHINAGFTIP